MSIQIIIENKKARREYEIIDVLEAGISLTGSEVKSLRNKQVHLKDAYISFRRNEAYLQNVHIAEYKASSYNNHEPERLRKLLLHRRELTKIHIATQQKGLTCIPLKLYLKEGKVKVEIALARGKKLHDKREDLKTKAIERNLRTRRTYE